ncbi:beta-lactamase-like protein [Irpex rosettiformis]|uniref:Beta-lactamase-like protein n=1 Tax=Irpex rosettiformis TaxID=378272 RepID=A0ACB8UFU2_9APHY|nr:beta-lactamase-like protein [Irpex rosettiformis]
MITTTSRIPADLADQVYARVKPIVAGSIFLPHKEVFQDAVGLPGTEGIRVPSFSFLISHPTKGNALFDLGLRKGLSGYPPRMLDEMVSYFDAKCEEDVADQFAQGNVRLEDIHTIILNHLHWDHIGNVAQFNAAKVVIGAPARAYYESNLYPQSTRGSIPAPVEGTEITYLDFSDSSSTYRLVAPFATFDRAVDFYGDGSVYVVDTPGHFPGHLSLVVRVAPNVFVFLAGDVCHNRECYNPGQRVVSELNNEDLQVARETARKLVKFNKESDNTVVILAHEAHWLEDGMPLFPYDVREWILQEIEKRRSGDEIYSEMTR